MIIEKGGASTAIQAGYLIVVSRFQHRTLYDNKGDTPLVLLVTS